MNLQLDNHYSFFICTDLPPSIIFIFLLLFQMKDVVFNCNSPLQVAGHLSSFLSPTF